MAKMELHGVRNVRIINHTMYVPITRDAKMLGISSGEPVAYTISRVDGIKYSADEKVEEQQSEE